MADSLGRVISRRFSLGQKAVALAPVLLLLVYLPAQAMLRCRVDGMLRPTCCCPHQGESESASPAIKAQDCCERQAAADTRPGTAAAAQPENRALAHMTAVALAASALPGLAPPIERPDWAWQRYGPAREGPPLVLLKHAFLI
jgi:hypothetical protein